MKKLIVLFLIIFTTLSCFSKTNDNYYNWGWNNYTFGVGYAHFNEKHGSDIYRFKNNQIDLFGSVYGVYLDASIGLNEFSEYDGYEMSTWGMNLGYLFPVTRPNYNDIRLFVGPVVGFQRVGTVEDAPWNDYYDYYSGYHYGTVFNAQDTYFNGGVVIGLSARHFWIQGKITRMNSGIGIGIKF